jgi:predicted MFS family arabinose efflux permease
MCDQDLCTNLIFIFQLDTDGDATQSSFGFIIALYSLGQILSAPVFGYWSNKIKRVKLPLYVGLVLMFFGNVVYCMLERFGEPRYMMMIGRFITGMGSGKSIQLYKRENLNF